MGLKDTVAFFEAIRPRTQVKAFIFGHTHTWNIQRDTSGLHLVNLTFLAVAGYPLNWAAGVLQWTLPALLLNTLAMLPVYHALRWLHTALYPPVVTA